MATGFLVHLLDGPKRASDIAKLAGVPLFGKVLLKQLEDNGWIEPFPHGPHADAYQLTDKGRQSLTASPKLA